MAIDPSGMVMKLGPVQSLDLTGFQEAMEHQQRVKMQREQLKLQREQFAAQQAHQKEQLEMQRIGEAGEMKRQELRLQQQREADEAQKQAALTTARRTAMANARKYLDDRDYEGVESLLPEMNELGMLAERIGEDAEGNPSYRIEEDRAAAEQAESAQLAQTTTFGEGETAEQSLSRVEAMGYPDNERGNLDDPSADRAPLPTDEMLMAEPSPDGMDAGTAEAYDPLAEQRARERNMLRPSSDVYGAAPRGLGPSMLSSGDAYAQALGASEYARQNNDQPLKGPDLPDEMGAVPSNVYDTGAMKSQAMRRLNPALQALAEAQPEGPYRESTEKTNEAVRALGLSPSKGLEAATNLRSGPDANIRAELAAGRKAAEDQAAAEKPLTRPELRGLEKTGWADGEAIGKSRGVDDIYKNAKSAAMILSLLSDNTGANDDAIAFQITNMLGSTGAQSNNDLRVALGIDAMDLPDQIKEKVHRWIKGGNTEERNKTLRAIVERSVDADDQTVFGLLESVDEQIAAATDPEVRRGLEKYRLSVPKAYRDAYDETGEEESEDGEPAPRQGQTTVDGRQATAGSIEDDDEFMDALQEAADEADIDPELILPLIGHESGGDPSVQNKQGSSGRGLIQFMDATAKKYTNPKTGKKFTGSEEFAQLSRAEQAPFIVKYLKDQGVTNEHDQGDVYVAIAAPAFLNEEDDAQVYKQGTPEYDLNQTWDLENDGVITRGEIYRWGMGERRKGGSAPKAKAKGKVASAPGGSVLKRLNPAGVEPEEPEAAEEAGELDAEVADILR